MDVEGLDKRLSALEQWRTLIEVSLGKHEVNSDYMKKEFSELKEELKEIKKTAKNLNLTIWGAVIVVFIKFALGGGLSSFI
jgi:archaellum component FlaC